MQKTQVRHPVLLDIGRFEARETVLYCPVCTDLPPVGSEELAAAVGAHRTFGYDVMAFVGQAGFRACHTADETVELLAGRNVAISESEVRELSARFIVSLGVAHARAAGRMRKQLHDAGGYILHLDSTCKAGSGHLLTAIDEISGLVLFNAKVAGESEDEVAGLLGTLSARYGLPAAMGVQIAHPDALVIDVAGEASFLMNIQELSTICQYKLPVKAFIVNNQWMGMVRQWQELNHGGRYSESYSDALPDFVKVADAFGGVGLVARTVDELDDVIDEMINTDRFVLADIRVKRDENCFPMIPSGAAHNEMLLGPNDETSKATAEKGMVLV